MANVFIDHHTKSLTDSDINTSALIRVFDLIISGVILILLAPIFIVIGFLIWLNSAGSIFYKEERVGKHGRIFNLYKLRVIDLNNNLVNSGHGSFVMKLTVFLNRTKLDRMPYLIAIFRGDMSLVGPWPQNPQTVVGYSPEQRQMLAVRPGITSPASLQYRELRTYTNKGNWKTVYRERIFPHKLALDLEYLRARTIWSDIALILKTVLVITRAIDNVKPILRLRNRHFFALDIIALSVTPLVALSLRLEMWNWKPELGPALALFTLATILITLLIFYNIGLYRRFWCFASVYDLFRIVFAVTLSTAILTILFFNLHPFLEPYGLAMYRTVPLIEGFLVLLTVGGSRFGVWSLHAWYRQYHEVANGRRTLIVGAGATGAMVACEMRANPQLNMEPVAFADDDALKLNSHIQGIPVMGTIEDIPRLVKKHHIQRIMVAMPKAALGRRQEIIRLCKQTGVTTNNVPGMHEILAGYKTVINIPQFEINQLLRREPIETDQGEVANCLAGTTILITGAGGSIGSELCRQVARCAPKEIILLGHGENSIFEISLNLRLSFPELVTNSVIADIRGQEQINKVIQKYRPNVVFHAAAHKHVPFMETQLEEAITNNVLGTRNVLQAAEQYGVERFVLISTDKAVNPTSIMGATKRLAELLVMAVAQRSGKAYMAVRFGNVLGSRGSVLQVFQQQIAAGGPLTITHPHMYRYFMTIPEAVQLVLQAAVLGKGGEAFVLDMGQQIRILDLAIDLIRLSGLELGRDINVIYSGIRPGEKLKEELFLAGENYQRTKHPKILVATSNDTIPAEVWEAIVAELLHLTEYIRNQGNTELMLDLLPKICFYIDQFRSHPEPDHPISVTYPGLPLLDSQYRYTFSTTT